MTRMRGCGGWLTYTALLLRCCAASPRPPRGECLYESRIDTHPAGGRRIRFRIGDSHPTGRVAASRRIFQSNANTFVRARAYGLFQPRVSEPTRRALRPLGWSLHTRWNIPIHHSPPSSIVTVLPVRHIIPYSVHILITDPLVFFCSFRWRH